MRTRLRSVAGLVVALLALAVPGFAQIGTLAPVAYQTVLDINGNPVSGAKVCFYVAGTTTPATTYSDVTLATPNANPLRADSSGRWTAYLAPGTSFKFVFQDSTGTNGVCDGAVIKTVDNVAAVPISSPSVDVTGLAGENLAAGAVVYLSDGSGGKTASQWYLADADFTYASLTAGTVGVPIAAISSAAQGSIRISGQITISTVLTPGAKYYVSATAGTLTTTAPANARFVGQADGVNSILLAPDPVPPTPSTGTECFRLTLTSGTPVTTADVTAATTLYATPKGCNTLALYDSAGTPTAYISTEFSIAVPATTNTTYDVFAFGNAGVAALELLAWRNSGLAITGATNATPIVITANAHGLSNGDEVYVASVAGNTAANGTWTVANITANTFELATSVGSGAYTAATGFLNARTSTGKLVLTTTGSYTKTADLTRRYLGSFRTTTVSGQTEDSFTKRFLWNYYHRVTRLMRVNETTDSWSYVTSALRQANAAPANQLAVVIGVAEVAVQVEVRASWAHSAIAGFLVTSIGENSTTTTAVGTQISTTVTDAATNIKSSFASLRKYPTMGYTTYVWLEYASGATATVYGDNGAAVAGPQSGISLSIEG